MGSHGGESHIPCHHIPVEEESLAQCTQEYQQLTLVANEEQKTEENEKCKSYNEKIRRKHKRSVLVYSSI